MAHMGGKIALVVHSGQIDRMERQAVLGEFELSH
jgi:hypothetical protein